jgi:hypothetical protein
VIRNLAFACTRTRLDLFVAFVFTAVITSFLTGPVFVMHKLQPDMKLTAIMLSFTFGFIMFCSLCTSLKRYETFAVPVAYYALLVAFASQNNNSNNGVLRRQNDGISDMEATWCTGLCERCAG